MRGQPKADRWEPCVPVRVKRYMCARASEALVRLSGRRLPSGQRAASVILAGALCAVAARADTFASVRYDAGEDSLVVSVIYRGTNPEHHFSLNWGPCRESSDGTSREIVAELLDDQWQDRARQNYNKTTRFPLQGLQCRPVKLTMRTAPRFYYTLSIPARTAAAPSAAPNLPSHPAPQYSSAEK